MRYKVVGNHNQDGVKPGGKLTLSDEKRARRLIRAGHLTPDKPKPPPPEDVEEPA